MTEKKLSPIQILRAETGDITTFPVWHRKRCQ